MEQEITTLTLMFAHRLKGKIFPSAFLSSAQHIAESGSWKQVGTADRGQSQSTQSELRALAFHSHLAMK